MVHTSKTKAQLIEQLEILSARVKTLEETQVTFGQKDEFLRSVAENAPVGIGVFRNGITLYVNQAYLRMSGYSNKDELIGKHLTDLVAPQCREELANQNRHRELGDDVPTSYLTTGLRKDGAEYPIQVRATHVPLPGGAVTISFFIDISERREVEEAARQAEKKYRDIREHALEGIFQSTPQGTLLMVNPAMARIYGYDSPEEMMTTITNIAGQVYADPQVRDEFVQLMQQNGKVQGFETRSLRKDGSIIWVSCSARAVNDDHGIIAYYEGTLEDITERKQAEERLMLLKLSVDASSDGAYWMNSEGQFLYANEAGCKVLGYSQEELLQMHIFDVNPRVTPERWAEVWKQLREEKHFISESIHRRKDGSLFPVEINSAYIQFGGQEYCNGFAHDISNRKQAEKALRESEEKFRRMADQAPMMIGVTDESGNITFLNKTWLDFRGKTLEEEAGWAWSAGLHPEDHDRVQAAMQSAIEQHEPYSVEYRIQDRHGAYHWVIDTATPLLDSNGQPKGYIGTALDITDRKRVEEASIASEERYRTLAETSHDMIFTIREDGVIEYVNRFAANLLEFEPKDIVGKHMSDVFTDVSGQSQRMNIDKALHSNSPLYVEAPITFPSGERWVSTWLVPLRDKAGRATSVMGVTRDITEQKQAESELFRSQQMLRKVLDNIPQRVFWKDQNLTYVGCNKPFALDCGYNDPSELIGKTDYETASGANAELYRAHDRQVMGTGRPKLNYEEPQIRPNGSTAWLVTSKIPLRDQDGQVIGVLGTYEDITERKRAEEALRQYTARLETQHEIDQAILLAETPQAIAEAALRHLRELIPCQRASVGIFDFGHDTVEAIASYAADKAQLVTGMRVPMKQFGIDDELLHGRISLTRDLSSQSHLPEVKQALYRQGIHSIVNVPLVAQDELIGALNLAASKPDGFTNQHIEIAREVADQLAITIQHARLRERDQRHAEELEQHVAERTAELRSAYEQLQALSRVKDEFVANVSHELRSPIASTKAYLHLLITHADEQEKYIETLKREVMRLEHLIEGLLTLSRLDQNHISTNLTSIDLNHLIDEYVTDRTLLANTKNLTMAFKPLSDMPSVIGDPQLIGDVLSILLTNAVNYTSAGGKVSIGTHIETSGNGTWAGFSVSDSGSGVPPEELPLLFERFYRGKAARETQVSGTGLGLSIAKEIIDLHCGRIEVHSDGVPGHGTRFKVWLPVEITS